MKTEEQIESYLNKLYSRLAEAVVQNEKVTERYLHTDMYNQINVFEEVKSTQDRITGLRKRIDVLLFVLDKE